MSQPTVVLVHGAFAESASWNGVIARLQAAGHRTIAVANPLRSLSGDTAAVKAVLDSIEGPVVLVGHSYGGAVITGAVGDSQAVKALVFVAGFAPQQGENIGELSARFPRSTLGETIQAVALADGTNDLYIRQELFHQQFAADLPADEAALAAATQRPLCDVALNEGAAPDPAWARIPSWFLVPELDRNIPAEAQRFMAERARAHEVVEVAGAAHALPVAHPDEVADAILRAAKATA